MPYFVIFFLRLFWIQWAFHPGLGEDVFGFVWTVAGFSEIIPGLNAIELGGKLEIGDVGMKRWLSLQVESDVRQSIAASDSAFSLYRFARVVYAEYLPQSVQDVITASKSPVQLFVQYL